METLSLDALVGPPLGGQRNTNSITENYRARSPTNQRLPLFFFLGNSPLISGSLLANHLLASPLNRRAFLAETVISSNLAD